MRTLGVGIVALAACAFASDRDFSIEAEPLFMATDLPGRVQPMLVTVENRGPETRGEVEVTVGEFSMRYPIDLPQGSKKRLIAYVTGGYYMQGTAVLSTPRGGGLFRIEGSVANSSLCVAGVSDAAGELGFLRTGNNGGQTISDFYLKPDLMPDRAAGYAGIQAVYLSDGSERMNDDAFAALKRYLLAGGTVVVSGGASMPLQNDPRWRPLLPVANARPKTLQFDGTYGGLLAHGQATIGVGDITRGSRVLFTAQDSPLAVERPYGLGRVVYIAINLTEHPAKDWSGRAKFLQSIGLLEQQRFGQLVDATVLQGQQNMYGGVPASASGMAYPGVPAEANDPFSARVPETSTVVGILLLYLVLVVPVNLLVLRKVGKGEWGWITSPIISLAFAAVFFRFSAALYSANLSVSTTGVLVAHQGDPDGYFLGKAQMFFPRGGSYDLQLKGVEAVFGAEQDYRRTRSSGLQGLQAVDVGEIIAPQASVTNLSFREFSLMQRIPTAGWFDVQVDYEGSVARQVHVANRSPYTLDSAGVMVGGKSFNLGSVGAGKTETAKASSYVVSDYLVDLANRQASQSSEGTLTGVLTGFRAGPRIGTTVEIGHMNWLIHTFTGASR